VQIPMAGTIFPIISWSHKLIIEHEIATYRSDIRHVTDATKHVKWGKKSKLRGCEDVQLDKLIEIRTELNVRVNLNCYVTNLDVLTSHLADDVRTFWSTC
jgi:hypothetical protein